MSRPTGKALMELCHQHGDPSIAEIAVGKFRNNDRCLVEVVDGLCPPLPRERKWVINVSTQFGCPVGCPFCDAAFEFHGNLTAQEILAQVEWVLARHPKEIKRCGKLKVHFARMGEPSLNDAVLEAATRLPNLIPVPGLWCCLATVAPKGRQTWFEQLFEIKELLYRGRFQLQFSVQSTSEEERKRLIPIPHLTLQELAALGLSFYKPMDRKVVLNFALSTKTEFNAEIISTLFDPKVFAVKITPINPTTRGIASGFRTVLRSEQDWMISATLEELAQRGFDVVVSVGDGNEDRIGSNCGQSVRIERSIQQDTPSRP
jgi:23S rRNA (adenine2503-C2)-methyltransferase